MNDLCLVSKVHEGYQHDLLSHAGYMIAAEALKYY